MRNRANLSFPISWPYWNNPPLISLSLSLSLDIDECKSGRNTCANDTVCFNLDGGYDCRCPHGHNCTGDCIYDSKVKHNGQIWVLDNDRCSVCSCQVSGYDTHSNNTNNTDCYDAWITGKIILWDKPKCLIRSFPNNNTLCFITLQQQQFVMLGHNCEGLFSGMLWCLWIDAPSPLIR